MTDIIKRAVEFHDYLVRDVGKQFCVMLVFQRRLRNVKLLYLETYIQGCHSSC